MPEINNITFNHKELAEILVKHQGIHEGIWGVYIEFGLKGANIGPDDNNVNPSAIVPVLKIGLQQFNQENSLSVDASKVNPAGTKRGSRTAKRSQRSG